MAVVVAAGLACFTEAAHGLFNLCSSGNATSPSESDESDAEEADDAVHDPDELESDDPELHDCV